MSIDDEPLIGELLQEVLIGKGYRVSIAAMPEEARGCVSQEPPQLIIMDYQIAESDGFMLIEEFRKSLPDTPILLLTGLIFAGQVARDSIQKRVDGYLDKTAPLSTIISEIQRLLGDPQDASICG